MLRGEPRFAELKRGALDTVADNKRTIEAERSRRAVHVRGVPYYFHVHLNQPCNQRCIMCAPRGSHDKGQLPLEEFDRFFAAIEPYAEHLTLIGGEPLMYPRIDDVLARLARRPIAVSINTNATLLRGEVVDRLLALHELHLKCSVDAATRATYLRIRGSDLFERVTANLDAFAARSSDRPRVHRILVYVVMRENLHEVVPFVRWSRRFAPARVELHPVRHVADWQVENGTGWRFDGREQSCEAFKDEYNAVLAEARAVASAEGIECETHPIP